MSSTTERISTLRLVGLFAETPDDILADVAPLLKPVEIPAGNAVVHKGDPGDCLYIIVNGRVRVHDGQRTLNFLKTGDVFGEMAMLDAEVRSASVTAVEDTRLFRLDQEPFYTLMTTRIEVARGVIRVLSQHLRGRVQDLARDFEYMQQMSHITAAAAALEAGVYEPGSLEEVAQREDELGQLARVFQRMTGEVVAREQRLKQTVQQMRIQIDKAKIFVPETFDLLPPFDFLTSQEKEWLAGRARSVAYPPGQIIRDPDDTDHDHLVLLMEGRIMMDKGSQASPRDLEAPAYFGERSVFFDQPSTIRYVSADLVHCFVLDGADIRELVKTNLTFSRAFASVFRHKYRLLAGYDAFLHLLFTKAEGEVVLLSDLVKAYQGLQSILHQAGSHHRLDFDALAYTLPRLPNSITAISSLILADELPAMYSTVEAGIRLSSRRAKRRRFYEILPGKALVVLRDHMTDTVDLITKLCIYALETGKIRSRLESASIGAPLAHFALSGGAPEAASEIEKSLPFTPEEMARLQKLFGEALLGRLYEIMTQVENLPVYFQKTRSHYTASPAELWLNRIRQALGDIMPEGKLGEDLDVHIISSNTHSVKNCLSSWLHERTEELCSWGEQEQVALDLPHPTDRLYVAYRQWAQVHPDEAAQREVWERAHGIHTMTDTRSTSIEVTLFDVNRLRLPIDPDIGAPAISRRTLLVNIDYAYGQQAEVILRSLILLFGQRIRSISVFGKSGATVGKRGDLLLPDHLLLQTNDELYPIPNQDLLPADFLSIGWEQAIHQGTLLTVFGTAMQSHEMLLYYSRFWDVIGMEMEGSFYLREILRAQSQQLIPQDTKLRFAYYVSDTPLEPEASLSSNLSAEEGVPPVYAITRAVLRRILSPEQEEG